MRTVLETKLGYSIPDELDHLLHEDENRYAELNLFRILADGYKYEASMSHFLTYQTFWDGNKYRDLEDFVEMFELDDSYVQSEYLYIIGETNGGNSQVCMALHGIHTGKIYICDNGDFGITLQAHTLQEFLNSLYPCDEDICSYEELTQSVVDRDLDALKDLIENKGGNLVLQRSSYCDRELFDLAYKNESFYMLDYLMSKGFYGFNRAEKYGLLNK